MVLKVKADSQILTLKCFIADDTLYDLSIKQSYKAGDTINIRFYITLSADDLTVLDRKRKSITLNPKYRNPHYFVEGQVMGTYPLKEKLMAQDYQRVVIDCGIYVHAEALKTAKLNVGDYIRTQGRLDADIVGKVE